MHRFYTNGSLGLEYRRVRRYHCHAVRELFKNETSDPGAVEPAESLAGAAALARGVARLLRELDYRVLTELPLANGRRADVVGLHRDASFAIVEIKASVADFRSDLKWPEYRAYCDAYYFAVGGDFPLSVLPEGCGVIVADAYQGVIAREAPVARLAAARRKALTLRFARTAAARLHQLADPVGGGRSRS